MYTHDPFDTDYDPFDRDDPKHPDYRNNLQARADDARTARKVGDK